MQKKQYRYKITRKRAIVLKNKGFTGQKLMSESQTRTTVLIVCAPPTMTNEFSNLTQINCEAVIASKFLPEGYQNSQNIQQIEQTEKGRKMEKTVVC